MSDAVDVILAHEVLHACGRVRALLIGGSGLPLGLLRGRRRTRGFAALHAGHVLLVVLVVAAAAVEVLELLEVLALLLEPVKGFGVPSSAVPRPRGVAHAVARVRRPLLALFAHGEHLKDAHLAVLGGVHLLEAARVHLHTGAVVVGVELEEQRVGHHWRGCASAVKAKHAARWIPGADVVIHRVANARHVWRLREVIAASTRPHEHVVSEVAHDPVRVLLWRGEAAPERGDMLVVPSVAVGNGGAVGDARDLVAVIPPGHDARIRGRIIAEPPVGLAVVVNEHGGAVAEVPLHHDGRVAHACRHSVADVIELTEVLDLAVQDGGGHENAGDARGARVVGLGHALHKLGGRALASAAAALGGLGDVKVVIGGRLPTALPGGLAPFA
mmetsp:Transcript_21668/g.58326  ORF Transcript_21668/g.58326 Transcript_21668/m.58326 type:complete len:386 (-) Transcript_21668:594-1751(-)